MTILLLNDNPVVNKLVTLSAQKTSDELDVVDSIDDIKNSSYDLLVLDDTVYDSEILNKLQEKITYKKSLFIYSKTSKEVSGFTSTLKKPFLPTDLVERFSVMGREISEAVPEIEEEISELDNEIALDELSLDDELPTLGEELSLDDELPSLDDELSLESLSADDELTDLDDELSLENISLDEEVDSIEELPSIEDEEIALEESLNTESNMEEVLNEEDILEIQELLEDTEEVLPELEQEESEEPLDDIEELTLDDEPATLEEPLDDIEELTLDDEPATLEEPLDDTEELTLDDEPATLEEPLDDIEELTLDDEPATLEEPISEVKNSDTLDTLTSTDIKIAIGEDLPEEEVQPEIEKIEEPQVETTTNDSDNSNVTALKNLLTALSDKDISASLKNAKISINITLGGD
ncbi:MAG: hypothetical protein U9P38_01595 [Campylobacterota bacterium]|nr:hypothetical protein [Campylobacterota bacterium]